MNDRIFQACRQRATVYRFLSGLLYRELSSGDIEPVRQFCECSEDVTDSAMKRGLEGMGKYLAEGRLDTRQDLAVDYAHSILGVGSYDQRMATPFESVFTSESGLLMQDAYEEVYRCYCEQGLGVAEGNDIPADHLALELEFMAYLCDMLARNVERRETDAATRSLETQRRFLRDHLVNWIDDYCDCLADVCLTEFYCSLGDLLRGFIHEDHRFIEDELSPLILQATRDCVLVESGASRC